MKAIKDKFGEKLGERAGALNAEAAKAAFDTAKVGRCKGDRPLVHKPTWLPPWEEIPPGTALPVANMGELVVGPGSSWQNLTGTWRIQSPYYMKEKCIRRLRCWWSCPEERSRPGGRLHALGLPLLQGLHLRQHMSRFSDRDEEGGEEW
jgi:hypothetical protein